jgi:hypothetical protein
MSSCAPKTLERGATPQRQKRQLMRNVLGKSLRANSTVEKVTNDSRSVINWLLQK